MSIRVFRLILCACLLCFSHISSAVIVSADWQVGGDNLITRDTSASLEWLDLTVTLNRSYNDISSKFGVGQEFEGWRYATSIEIASFFDAFGGDSDYYEIGWSTQNNGLLDAMSPYWGDTYCETNGCAPGEGYVDMVFGELYDSGVHWRAVINDIHTISTTTTQDFVDIHSQVLADVGSFTNTGNALVRNISPVPVPAAVWLFGSGLIGLIGLAKSKKIIN